MADLSTRVATALGALAFSAGIMWGVVAPYPSDGRPPIVSAILPLSMVFGLWALWSAVIRASQAWGLARRRNAKTVGRVDGRRLDQVPADGQYVYQAILKVSYRVGRRTLGVEWAPSKIHASGGGIMDRVNRKYPDGTEVIVHYEAERPENASVDRAWFAPILSVTLLGVFAAGVALTSFFVTSAFTAPNVTEQVDPESSAAR